MNQGIETLKVKKVLYESVWVRGTQQRTVTRGLFQGQVGVDLRGEPSPGRGGSLTPITKKGRDAGDGRWRRRRLFSPGRGAYKP